MKFLQLNAVDYKYTSDIYHSDFEEVLSKIIVCYNLMKKHRIPLSNNENIIRDVLLLNYLKNNDVRKELNLINYIFDREVPEDKAKGRTDIKIQTPNSFVDTNAYFIIECKRLNRINPKGSKGLNAKYIKDGICRFVDEKYSSHYKTNGMIGFVVDNIDIHTNVDSINDLLKTTFVHANTRQELRFKKLHSKFKYSYLSSHKTNNNDEIKLYHLMFDFSKNIK